MKISPQFNLFLLILLAFQSHKTFSQCFEIESILVAACAPTPNTEGYNEMVRFKVGATPLNVATLSVNWPSNPWQGLAQNTITATKVAAINTQITIAGGCGQMLEPVGGIIPANAKVILITSYNFTVTSNVFGAITENIYIIFQDNATQTGGHFGNSGTGTRTLTMTSGACSDSVTYNRALLLDTTGVPGSAPGATANFTPAGVASYTNPGCVAPVEVFSVEAGTTPLSACPGDVIALNGTAQGHQSVQWTAPDGTFSNPNLLITNFTVPASATSTLTLTLSATNTCGTTISDNIVINLNPFVTPAFNAITPICAGAALSALPTTSTNGISGSWSPALDNTATTIYTFTPNAGQCAVTTTLTITVNPANTVPTFTTVAPICTGSTLSALPTTSLNGITGSWSPALDNTATTTYTFTPNAGQCAVTTTLTITVNPINTVPTFTAVAPVCSGSTLSALPTTSVDGITGSWSPALDNTATTTYTFTPDTGQCAVTTTLIITVDPLIVPAFNSVAAICSGTTLAALPTSSTNGITGSWSPALNNTATTTYTFTPATGQCATTTTLIITVNPNVTPAFNPVASICSGSALAALPTTSLNGVSGNWSPALNNTTTTTYTFTPAGGQCATTTTLIITVNPNNLTPTFSTVTPICSGNTLAALPTTSLNGITGSWSPALNNTATTTYTFTPATGQCATTTTLAITVNPNVTPAFNPVAPICSGTTISALPTTSLNAITGSWSPALNNTTTTTYTFTPNAGQCAVVTTLLITVTPKITPTFNPVAAICSGGVLSALPTTSLNGISGSWIPALNNTATTTYTFTPGTGQCATTAALTIAVNPSVTPVFNPVAAICSGSVLNPLPTTSLNGITGVWSPALNNTVTTTYTFTPTTGQCAATATLIISVNPIIAPIFNPVAPICPGTVLSALPSTSINGITGSWSPALNNTATTTYTFTPAAAQCASIATLVITVKPVNIVPAFNPVATICAGTTLANLPATSLNGITGSWAPAINNMVTTTYTFTPAAGQCALTTTLTIAVDPVIVPNFITALAFCSGAVVPVLNTTSPNGILGTWQPAIIDNTASGNYIFTPDAGQCAANVTLVVTVTDNITKNGQYVICVNGSGNAITTATIATGLSPLQYTFVWTLGSTVLTNIANSLTVSDVGVYTVVATNRITGCTITIVADVVASLDAVAIATVGNDFDDVQQIVVTVTGGLGNYSYQLDNGPFQSSNVFNVSQGGDYTVHVKDNLGCNNFILQVTALNYPKFFTPNGDGYNDTWNIKGLPNPAEASAYIFDRYGKLIFQMSLTGLGWNGLYNGRELPATDYWFLLQYSDKNGIRKEFKSHFALKR